MHKPNTSPVEGLEGGFDERVYRAWNPDVDAAIRAGSLASGRLHFESFGRNERRAPFFAPAGTCGTPALRVGDELVQAVKPRQDEWAGVAFSVGTHGDVAHVVLDCSIVAPATMESVRSFCFEEWVGDGETLVLKFPPIAASCNAVYLLRLLVRAVEAVEGVHLICRVANEGDGLIWNGAAPAAVRGGFDLLYAPATIAGPLGITLSPLTHCDGGCIHCLARSHQKTPGSLKPEWVASLRAHFRDGPGVAWCVDYATDFFKVAQWRPELIELLAAKGDVSINTEGQHVTAEALRRLLRGNLGRIGFSCDAATEATYAIVRKRLGKLETVLEAARLAVRFRRETGCTARPCIAMSMVVMKTNVHEVAAFVDLAARTGVDAVWYNQLWVCSAEMLGESLMFTPALWREQLERARQRGRELGIGVSTAVDIRPEHPQEGISWCPEPWSSMVVLGNGDVLSCASPASRIGSLRESTIGEIWNGEAFQELRRRVNSDRPPLMCRHCFVYRKPGNADGVFMHHLTDGYDLRRDLADVTYADAFRGRFSFAQVRLSAEEAVPCPDIACSRRSVASRAHLLSGGRNAHGPGNNQRGSTPPTL